MAQKKLLTNGKAFKCTGDLWGIDEKGERKRNHSLAPSNRKKSVSSSSRSVQAKRIQAAVRAVR